MDTTKFASWKYQHAGTGYRSPRQRMVAAILLVGAVVAYFSTQFPPVSIALGVIGLLVLAYSAKKIFLGPRYLICGDDIVYYRNVVRMALEQPAGRLLLVTATQQSFTLERDKFPTNARKAGKIAANRAAKFSKVSQNLIDRVRRVSPGVEITGVAP